MIITCCVCTHCRSVFYVWEDIYCCWLLRLNWKIFCCPRLIANLKSRKQSAVDFPLLVSCTKSFIASLQSNRWSLRNWQLLFTGKTWSSDSTVESWRECVSAYVGVLVCVCACACACKCVYVWLHVHVRRWYRTFMDGVWFSPCVCLQMFLRPPHCILHTPHRKQLVSNYYTCPDVYSISTCL